MRNLQNEIKKNLYFPLLCLSCLGIVGICLLSECYIGENGKSYTIIEVICSMKREAMLENISLNRLEIWRTGLGLWARLLLPCLLSVGYLYSLSGERDSGALRLLLIRESNVRYSFSKIVSAMFCGGMVLLVGYTLFGLIVFFCFPSLDAYPANEIIDYINLNMPKGVSVFVVKQFMNLFLYGVSMNLLATGISLFFMDKYILLSLPIMLHYAWGQIMQKITLTAFEVENFELAEKIQMLQMDNLLQAQWNASWCITLGIMMALYVFLFLLFCIVLKKRGDSGEWS